MPTSSKSRIPLLTTQAWAEVLGLSTAPNAPAIAGGSAACMRSAREIAVRTVVLQGIVAKTFGVESEKIIGWFDGQKIRRELTPREQSFLENKNPGKTESGVMSWHCEAEWALLWSIGKVDALGLPTAPCDVRRMVDEVMPPLGSDIKPFLKSAKLRAPGALAAEDERTSKLWHDAMKFKHTNRPLPGDLVFNVLYERRYAFEWLKSKVEWDKVVCEG